MSTNTAIQESSSPEQRELLRRAIRDSLPNEAVAFSQLQAKYIFVPVPHRRALDPDAMLVVGIRGAGKSFWWHTILDPEKRKYLAGMYLRGQKLLASSGFGQAGHDAKLNWPLKETLEKLLINGHEPRWIWRSVLIEHLEPDGESQQSDEAWTVRVNRLKDDPAAFTRKLQEHNEKYKQRNEWYLLLFDALDNTADHRDDCLNLLRGVLELTLDLRRYSNIAAKAFVRPDMLAAREVAQFPDSAKVLANQVALHWGATDLYALLFQYLGNSDDVAAATYFRSLSSEPWVAWQPLTDQSVRFDLPLVLRNDPEAQEKLLRKLADPYLGPGPRNGKTYHQLVSQLADAHGIVSPRVFLTAVRRAADFSDFSQTDRHPLHHRHLLEGIRLASPYRAQELREDYQINGKAVRSPDGQDVHDAMMALRGLEVPCRKEEILDIWKNKDVSRSDYQSGGSPISTAEYYQELLRLCERLGVVEQLPDGDFNVPNVYLLAFGLQRTGRFRRPSGS